MFAFCVLRVAVGVRRKVVEVEVEVVVVMAEVRLNRWTPVRPVQPSPISSRRMLMCRAFPGSKDLGVIEAQGTWEFRHRAGWNFGCRPFPLRCDSHCICISPWPLGPLHT
jgi:hypothetical protein